MPKFFVISDIHGFYNEMITTLEKAGFDKENKDHWLISCGDCFDRGGQPIKVMEYLQSLPRKILVKGNHEDLLVELCKRKYFYSYDKSNGTLDTVIEFAKLSDNEEGLDYDFVLNKITPFINSMVDYFETEKYVFVHGFIPTNSENWRKGDWQSAVWDCGIKMAKKGLNRTGKTIVCGHWHCSTGHSIELGISEFGEDAIWEPYYDEDNGLIAIDRCTAYTGECNVLVIEDNFLEEKGNGD